MEPSGRNPWQLPLYSAGTEPRGARVTLHTETESGGRLLHVEHELRRLVRAALPGAFVFIEDADGSSLFFSTGRRPLKSTPFTNTTLQYLVDTVADGALGMLVA